MVAVALQVLVRFDAGRFGSDFRAWRVGSGLTLRQAARATQSSQSLLSRVERGESIPRGDVMCRMLTLSSLDLTDYCTTERDRCAS